MVSKKILAFALGIGLAAGASSSAFAMSDGGVVDDGVVIFRPTPVRSMAAAEVIQGTGMLVYLSDAVRVFAVSAVLSVMTDPRVAECFSLLSTCKNQVLRGACESELKSLADEVDAKLKDLYRDNERFRDACNAIGFNPYEAGVHRCGTGFEPDRCGTGFEPDRCGTGFEPNRCGTGFEPNRCGTGFGPCD